MSGQLLGTDRVMLLLSLVPYLREHGPTPVTDLARAFSVDAIELRSLVEFLGTAGVPGETMTYQDEDLFDIDWDALEQQDIVSLTRTVAVEEAPRFSPAETAALIAGLQTLTTMLPAEAADLARATAEKLGTALQDESTAPALTVSEEPHDPRVPAIAAAIAGRRTLRFDYRDAEGVSSSRRADPIALEQRANSWYLRAYCHDRAAERTFRLDRMRGVVDDGAGVSRASAEERSATDGDASRAAEPDSRADQRMFDIVARVESTALPRIAAFAPEIIDADLDDLAGNETRVRVEAWHSGTAIQLVQSAPGEVTIEGPHEARAAVRAWAERSLAPYA